MPRRNRIFSQTVALVTLCSLMAACSDDDAGQKASDAEPRTSVSPAAAEDTLPAGVQALPEPGAGADSVILSGGTYRVPLSETLSIDVDLPSGTESRAGGLYLVHEDTILKVEAAGAGFGVPSDPCNGFVDITPAGSTVGDVVRAIDDKAPYRVERPEAVEIGGAVGKHFELRIPAGVDASSCDDGQVGLPGNPGSNNSMAPGYVGQWWILEVDGQLAVLQTFCEQCRGDGSTTLTDALQGITFTTTP